MKPQTVSIDNATKYSWANENANMISLLFIYIQEQLLKKPDNNKNYNDDTDKCCDV